MFWKPWTLLLQPPDNNEELCCPLDLVFCRHTSQELTSDDRLCFKGRTSLVFVAVCHTSVSFPSYFLLPNSLFVSEKSAPFLTSVNKLEDSGPAEDSCISRCMCWVVFVNGAYLEHGFCLICKFHINSMRNCARHNYLAKTYRVRQEDI